MIRNQQAPLTERLAIKAERLTRQRIQLDDLIKRRAALIESTQQYPPKISSLQARKRQNQTIIVIASAVPTLVLLFPVVRSVLPFWGTIIVGVLPILIGTVVAAVYRKIIQEKIERKKAMLANLTLQAEIRFEQEKSFAQQVKELEKQVGAIRRRLR